MRAHMFVKVEIEHDRGENLEKLGQEICRQILKLYPVRSAEVSSVTPLDE
ncbi:MAG: hypothetical protein ACRD96_01375 [Bryobacteraceae bacterium]